MNVEKKVVPEGRGLRQFFWEHSTKTPFSQPTSLQDYWEDA